MGGKLHPPSYELNKDFYCRNEDKSDRWRNIFENPTTVQFDHRMLVRRTLLFLFPSLSRVSEYLQSLIPTW